MLWIQAWWYIWRAGYSQITNLAKDSMGNSWNCTAVKESKWWHVSLDGTTKAVTPSGPVPAPA